MGPERVHKRQKRSLQHCRERYSVIEGGGREKWRSEMLNPTCYPGSAQGSCEASGRFEGAGGREAAEGRE